MVRRSYHLMLWLIWPQVHLRIPQLDRCEGFVVPVFMSRRRESQDLALTWRGALDEALHVRVFAAAGPLVVALEMMSRGAPDEVVAEAYAGGGGHVAGAMPGAHGEEEQVAGVGEDGTLVLRKAGVFLRGCVS